MIFAQEVSFYNDEYIASVIKSYDTKFNVLDGYVGAIITESELTTLRNGDGTMFSRLASAELTIDGLDRKYSEVKTDYSKTTNSLNTLSSRVTQISESVEGVKVDISDIQTAADETDTRLAQLSLTVDGFNTKISQAKTEAITSANNNTADKLKNYTMTSQLTSYINQQVGKINLGVIAESSTIATKAYADQSETDALNAAKNYADTQLKSYTKTADLTIDLDGIRTSVTSAKTEAINAANTATDNKLKDYTKTTSLVSYINQQAGKIKLGVIENSSTLATKAYADQSETDALNAAKSYADTQLKSYTKTADLTIDLDGIRTSVTSAKTEAINAANTATDNKLKNYTTTTNLMSYINQQAGSIKLAVIKDSSTLATKTDASNAEKNAKAYVESKTSKAEIVAKINEDSSSTIKISADKIALNGNVSCSYLKGGILSLGKENNSGGQIYMYNSAGKLLSYWTNSCMIFKHEGFEGTLKGSASRFNKAGFSAWSSEKNIWTTMPSSGMNVTDGDGNVTGRIYPGLVTGTTQDTVTDSTEKVTLNNYTNVFPDKIVSTDAKVTTSKYKFSLCRDETDTRNFGFWFGKGVSTGAYDKIFGFCKNDLLSWSSPPLAASYLTNTSLVRIGNGSNKTDVFQQGNQFITGTLTVTGKLRVMGGSEITGGKNRVMDTGSYGKRLLYCYETAAPQFGDVGEGTISEDGLCYIYIDPILLKTISGSSYQVFLQKYGEGDAFVLKREADYFVVAGTKGLSFAWEIKGLQHDLTLERLPRQRDDVVTDNKTEYADEGFAHYCETIRGGDYDENSYVGSYF